VYCAGVRAGNERDWDYMWSKLEIESIAAERSYLLSGLACAQQPELINRYLNEALKHTTIRLSEVSIMFENLEISNPNARTQLLWPFVQQHWQKRLANAQETPTLTAIFKAATSACRTREALDEIREFAKENAASIGKVSSAYETTVESCEINIGWMDTCSTTILQWAKKKMQGRG